MAAFAAGDLATAFDTFMRGICGDDYRTVIEGRLGSAGYDRAIRDSGFFFRDEVGAVQQWQFDTAEAARVRQPALIVEGGESARLGPMSRQITELATWLLPHADVATIAGVNHALRLQDPDAVARLIATFLRRHPIVSSGETANRV
jgi:pimeloyl-ACP methyl ester carboxylesterase